MKQTSRDMTLDLIQSGQRIRKLRREKCVSIDEVLDACGLEGPHAFYRWTSGRLRPSVDSLYALSRVLDVPLDELVVFHAEQE